MVEAALGLIDREGLTGFSVRRLASNLGVYPAAVYWHLGRRNDILAAVVDHVLKEVGKAPAAPSWEESLRRICFAYRAALRCHPNVAPLLGADLTSNLGVPLDFVESVFAALHRGASGSRGGGPAEAGSLRLDAHSASTKRKKR
ncbi:MAG: TetR family transcriptional regulator [Kiloniellales bacterium]|nr:TetR family transcriptional regulator [Kiloniellales bacterium]